MKNTSSTQRHSKSRNKSITEKPDLSSNNKRLPQTRNLQPHAATIQQSPLNNVDYSFKIGDTVRRNIYLIKRTVDNTDATKSYGATRISIGDRITERINSGQSGNPVLGWSLLSTNQLISSSAARYFRNRFVRMATTRSKSNHPYPNISITVDHLLKIRKKRLNKKLKEFVSENEVASESDPVAPTNDTNLDNNVTNTENISIGELDNAEQYNWDNCHFEDNDNNISQNNNCTAPDESNKNRCDTNLPIQTVILEKCSSYQIDNTVKQNEEIIDLIDDSLINLTVSETPEVQHSTKVNDGVVIDLDIDDCLRTFSKTNRDEELEQITFFNCTKDQCVLANFNSNCMKNTYTGNTFIKKDPPEEIEDDDIDDAVIFFSSPGPLTKLEKKPKKMPKTNNNQVITLTPAPIPVKHSNIETIITSRETFINNFENKMENRLSTSSVIEIADDTDVSSADIIFVDEKRASITSPRKRKLAHREPSLIIVDDDDDDDSNCKLISVDDVKKTRPVKKVWKHRIKRFRKKKNRNAAKVTAVSALNVDKSEAGALPGASSVPDCRDTLPTNQQSDRILQLLPQPGSNSALPNVGNTGYFLGNNMSNTGPIRREGLREIIIDGSNVALGHTNGLFFSVEGLRIAIYHFTSKGHKVTAFVPQYRVKNGMCSNTQLLTSLNKQRLVIFTPSREVHGKRITPYDDRYIIQYATACEGVVVSNDNYRDLLLEKPEWGETIARRLLMYTWVDNVLMFPEDPLGRFGPHLSRFLRFP